MRSYQPAQRAAGWHLLIWAVLYEVHGPMDDCRHAQLMRVLRLAQQALAEGWQPLRCRAVR